MNPYTARALTAFLLVAPWIICENYLGTSGWWGAGFSFIFFASLAVWIVKTDGKYPEPLDW